MAHALRQARKLGFRAIDVTCLGDFHGVDPIVLVEQGGLKDFASQIADSGFIVSSINAMGVAELAGGSEVDLELCRRRSGALIELARALDCRNVTSQLEDIRGLSPQARVLAVANYRRHFPEFGRLYADGGIQLSFENHEGTCFERPEVIRPLLEAIFPVVGLTYDSSHLTAQDIPLPETAELLKYAVHCHARAARPGFIQCHLKENKVDFEWMVQELNRRGYSGAIAIEFFGEFASAENVTGLRDRLLGLGVGQEIPAGA